MPTQQRRARAIAMSSDELDEFLAEQRTCRMATVGFAGHPHNVPLWFVWDGTSMWINSVMKSQRWTDLARDPRVSVVVDAGVAYGELRGAELLGAVRQVGEVPRTNVPVPELTAVERAYAAKYADATVFSSDGRFLPDGRHAWLQLRPAKVVTWDFRKLPSERRG